MSQNNKLPRLPKVPSVPKVARANPAVTGGTRITTSISSVTAGSRKISTAVADQSLLSERKFGTAPGLRATSSSSSSSSGSEWSTLAKNVSTGGLSGAFDKTGGLGGGIGSLISGLVSLFGGGGDSTTTTLTAYKLPSSQQQVVHLSSSTQSQSASHLTAATPVYGTTPSSSSTSHSQNDHIVQVVKQALLTSSSLNDVIAEI